MSITASIDLSLFNNSDYIFSSIDLLELMINNNWIIKKNNKISYLPLGDDDLFEWTENEMKENELKEIIKKKEIEKEIIGIVFYWENTDIGVSMLCFPDNQITFNLNINRVVIDEKECREITDTNWYLERIIPCLKTDKFKVQNVKFCQEW